MTAATRIWSTLGALVITGGLLAGCTPASSGSDGNGEATGAPSNSLDCNWDSPAVTVETATDPDVKEGELAEVMVGEWQRIGYDIGAGFQAYGADPDAGERDYRFVFNTEGEYVDCQSAPKVDRDESRGDYTVEKRVIDLGDDGKFTARSWNTDTMTWRSKTSGALIYLQRR